MATLAGPDAWHYVGTEGEPAFASGWENAGVMSPLAFRLDHIGGEVKLYGLVLDNGPADATVCTLPAEYRPPTGRYGVVPVAVLDSMGAYRGGVAVVADDGTLSLPGTDTADTAVVNGAYPLDPPEL